MYQKDKKNTVAAIWIKTECCIYKLQVLKKSLKDKNAEIIREDIS